MKFQENVSLAKHSNYRIGGPARYFYVARTPAEVRAALALAKEKKLSVFILGGGTNIIFPDKGWNGLVLKVDIGGIRAKKNIITAGAGVTMRALLEFAAKRKLAGLSWAGGLPGLLGGAVRGNAGCFGGETKDTLASVRTLNTRTLKEKTWTNKQCRFSYRSSIFKERDGEEVVLEASFRLKKGSGKAIRMEMEDHIRYRKERQPLELPNIGSIFKNVPLQNVPKKLHAQFAKVIKIDPFPVVPTAYLLSEANLKGVTHGGAMFSPKHPNFIVNIRKAKATDVKALVKLAQSVIKKKFGIRIEPEVIEV
jgi:UDP-N-acetylmuramate dehydrogenase